MVKVLFFGDFGVDDTVALLFSHLSQMIEIVGIVADYGNVQRSMTVRNAHYILRLLNQSEIKVFTGAVGPLSGETPEFYPDIHGIEGLGSIIPTNEFVQQENFLEVIEIIKKYKDDLIIINTGRLTSLATLFILYNDLMKRIKAFHIMGGAFIVPGNISPVAEANFYGDPTAANIVMKKAKNLFIYPLDVTMKAIVTPQMEKMIQLSSKTKDIFDPLLDDYYNFYKKMNPNINGSPIHDVLPFMALVNQSIFTYFDSSVDIVTDKGIAYGQSIADLRVSSESLDNTHKIAIDIDELAFYKLFMNVMS